ncbi:MAG TPA: RNA-binding transcriptional accessory protein [Clostridiales bacterium]|nr:RNA-binding transcriptional accessory protein [Clostridiales bacterium]
MDIKAKLSEEFNLKPAYAANIVDLIEEGNTIPFIARYRKEMHGGQSDELLRDFSDRLTYLKNLTARKDEVRAAIEGQGKWTDELAAALDKAVTLTEVEDVYRPYKQKKKTRASVAVERGLEPLADIIFAQEMKECDLTALASEYIDEEKGVASAEDAINGAKDIIAERVSDDAEIRKALREFIMEEGTVSSAFNDKQEDKEKLNVYEMYKEFSEKIKTLPSHRILALNRGEKDECLKVTVACDNDRAVEKIKAKFMKPSAFDKEMSEAIEDSYDRLIFPSIEREVRNELTDKANEQAIKMFEVNLKPLLMQPPLKGKVIIGLDPAYRTGCKIAVIDQSGNMLDHTVIFPTPPQNKTEEAKRVMLGLIKKYNADVISIGNGTASKESEIFVADLIKDCPRKVQYMVVNEAGASVYSASKLGTEEFPNEDVTVRSAVSIARRLMDPLAELIKIDVKSIGVGQYQHDMPQKRLTEVLEGVVEDCVNSVGVDLNTASYSLLAYVSGLNTSIAKNIVAYRAKTPFTDRRQLLEVGKLGPKAFQQCAGFLRIQGGDSVLDNTGVHPESYEAAEKLLKKYGYTDDDVKSGGLGDLKAKVKADGEEKVAEEIGVGALTLHDIVEEILKPGRDIRADLPAPVLRADLMDMKDLKEGMELTGTVRNVIDFGAFVDIGVHHDGLVHVSEISDRFIKHPSEALSVGQVVKVKVIGVDPVKQRINLSIKQASGFVSQRPAGGASREKADNHSRDNRNFNRDNRGGNRDNRNFNRDNRPKREEKSLDDMLAALKNKYNKH